MLRLGDIFIIDGHVLRFSTTWCEELQRFLLEVETAPRAPFGCYSGADWAFLRVFQTPKDFEFKHFLNVFWREVRQNRPVDIEKLIDEVAGEATSRELTEV